MQIFVTLLNDVTTFANHIVIGSSIFKKKQSSFVHLDDNQCFEQKY